MARSPRRPLAVLAVAAAVVTGCSPITTQMDYAPSDGVQADIGELRAANLMIVTEAEGSPGALLGAITNRAGEATTVELALQNGESVSVDVDPGATTLFGPDHEDVTFDEIAAVPGALIDVQVSSPESGSVVVAVPVLDGTLEPYGDYLP